MDSRRAYPILPLSHMFVFPHVHFNLVVSGQGAAAALAAANSDDEERMHLVFITRKEDQKDPSHEISFYPIGTLGVVRKVEKKQGKFALTLDGLKRVRIDEFINADPRKGCLRANFEILPAIKSVSGDRKDELEALLVKNQGIGREIAAMKDPQDKQKVETIISQVEKPDVRMYSLISLFQIELANQWKIIEASDLFTLLTETHDIFLDTRTRMEIAHDARKEMEKQQRDNFLRHQKRAIESALGDGDDDLSDTERLRKSLAENELPELVREEAEREIRRMERMSAHAADFQISRSYLELILELPWNTESQDRLNITTAKTILDADHFALEDVKDRILEHLAVMQMNPDARASIMCFIGPAGVGKTSLGQSIAKALGRKFERIALGGLHDESELRGHRRTYIGAMPGRILQAIRRAKAKNPLIMLDEIDKLGRDFRGDPAAALMEILDPAQNCEFRDNYLNLPFDLSRCMFIMTANDLDPIPQPLLDRMEVLELSGYSDMEKTEIAKRYLIPRQRKEAGLTKRQFTVQSNALLAMIRNYTREAGVRGLNRTIARVARKQARRILEGQKASRIGLKILSELLGPQKYFSDQTRKDQRPGVATGMAWTRVGGEILYVEAILAAKSEGMTLTGQLGDVMKESAHAARSYIWEQAPNLHIDRDEIENNGVHIHVPAGAVRKDGPSAGVAIATALASLYSNQPVRGDVAMTGEITLAGLVLPIGGLKEKVLAAHRTGIGTVILPAENGHELSALPDHVRTEIVFVQARNIADVLRVAIPDLYSDDSDTPGAPPARTKTTGDKASSDGECGVDKRQPTPDPGVEDTPSLPDNLAGCPNPDCAAGGASREAAAPRP